MHIRKFKDSDSKKVSYLIRKCIKEIYPLFYSKKVVDMLYKRNTPKIVLERSKKRDYYLMVKEDRILGVMAIENNEIKSSYVNPRYHRKGIGRQLLYYLEQIAKKKFKKLIVHSSEPAITFYTKCGFKKIKKISEKYKGVMLEAFLMEKKLMS